MAGYFAVGIHLLTSRSMSKRPFETKNIMEIELLGSIRSTRRL